MDTKTRRLYMEFFRQEHWSGLPFPPPGDLPNPGIVIPKTHTQALQIQLEFKGYFKAAAKSKDCIEYFSNRIRNMLLRILWHNFIVTTCFLPLPSTQMAEESK